MQDGCLDGLACGIHEFQVNARIGCFAKVLKGNVDAEVGAVKFLAAASSTVFAHHRGESDILYMKFLTCFEIDVAMYAAHAEHVLVFDVRAVAPAIDFYANEVLFARLDVFRHVELGIHIGSLSVAYLLSVHPDIGCAVDAIEVEIDFSAVPGGGDCDGAAIAAHCVGFVQHGVALLPADEGRLVLEGIGDVGVDGCAVPLHLPTGGHGYGLPRGSVEFGFKEVEWAVFGFWSPMELPLSVEHQPEGRVGMEPRLLIGSVALHLFRAGIEEHRGASGLFVDTEDGLVLPVVIGFPCFALGLYLEVCLGELPLDIVAGICCFHLPDVSARLTGIVVSELQSACGAGQGVGLVAGLLDEPLLVGVPFLKLPGEHFTFCRTVIAVVECYIGAGAVETPITLTVGFDDAPHLCLCFLIDGREGYGAVQVVQRKPVADFQPVTLIGVKVLSISH